ncbi:hypothetical protein GGD89_003985, partial [Roseospira visakhapatnamensis]|nr:hypothetical protein [Roseospira visakhapatnamensis]
MTECVPVPVDPTGETVTGRTTRLNITMDTTLVAAIDSVTSNRSAWL